jgi:hypothetical protein
MYDGCTAIDYSTYFAWKKNRIKWSAVMFFLMYVYAYTLKNRDRDRLGNLYINTYNE